ncbi:ROK family protein [Kineococcus sp. NUM-3379]
MTSSSAAAVQPHRAARAAGTPARQGSLRDANLALALGLIAAAPEAISRAGIAAATGVTRATASTLVDALVAAGLVTEVGTRPRAGGGRPATGLRLSPDGPAGLGLEVGVDYAAACVVDLTGAVRHLRVVAHDCRGGPPEQVLRALARLGAQALAATELPVHAATLAVPGLVRAPSGPVQLAPNLGWRDLDVLALLGREPALAALELSVGNEADLAALAELDTSPTDSFVHVSGETGVGAGIVLDGRIFRGRHGWSGELGHVPVDPDGPPCNCGSRGCLEQFAGQEAILHAAGVPAPVSTALGGSPTSARLVELARRGEPRVVAALARAGTALGTSLAGAMNLLDVDTVVLGGVYRDLAPWIAPEVEREVRERVVAAPWAPPVVRVSLLGAEAAVVGAATSVVRDIVAAPARWVPAS